MPKRNRENDFEQQKNEYLQKVVTQRHALAQVMEHLAAGTHNKKNWWKPGVRHTIPDTRGLETAGRIARHLGDKQIIKRAEAYKNHAAIVRHVDETRNGSNALKHSLRHTAYQSDPHTSLEGYHNVIRNLLSNRGHVLGHARHYPYPARANIHHRNKYGTPLHYAIKPDDLKLLLEKGANVNARNHKGRTALHRYTSHLSSGLSKIAVLLEHGADINARDVNGRTPLHIVASESYSRHASVLEIAKFLIEHGANVHALDNDGKTPAQLASSPKMAKLLRNAEAKSR